ncbi:MarR family transcriptional regulator [Allomuricauda sp. d1]|uniref:MarR family winged helix-turn-helix transcriptional regulator n=1 Tax=Allomuricauda sp. d1 TaxID=3136725 RepID=UPI0031D7693B
MNVEEIIKTSSKLPLERRTIIHLTLVQNKVNEMIATALKPFDVSLQQFNVLRILKGQRGNPANLSTLNERMVTKMSNTTRLVDKLLAKGYVKRNVCRDNRRKIEIFITNQGLEALESMNMAVKQAESEAIQAFSENELKELNRLLDKF